MNNIWLFPTFSYLYEELKVVEEVKMLDSVEISTCRCKVHVPFDEARIDRQHFFLQNGELTSR